jgi:hypothetical protein
VEQIAREMPSGASFEEFVIVLLYDLWPGVSSWKAGWPMRTTDIALMDIVGNAMDAVMDDDGLEGGDEFEPDAEIDSGDDEDEDMDSDDDEGDDDSGYHVSERRAPPQVRKQQEPDDPIEARRARRHAEVGGAYETVVAEFVRNILPQVDGSLLSDCLTDWDRETWNKGRWL